MTHTPITSPPHSSHMYTSHFGKLSSNLHETTPPFRVNSFEILKYFLKYIYIVTKKKLKRQGKRKEKIKKEINRRSEKKENKLEEYLLLFHHHLYHFHLSLPSITIHIIWELNYHKWYHLCFLKNPFCLHTYLLLTTSFL